MDVQLARLADEAGATIAALLFTDDWEIAKGAVRTLWQQVDPNRVSMIESELDQSRVDLTNSPVKEALREALTTEWRGRLRRLLTVDPERAIALDRVLEKTLRPAVSRPASSRSAPERGTMIFHSGDGSVTGSFSSFVIGMNTVNQSRDQ